MFRIRRFSVIKTANVVALIYMVVVAIFAVPFALLVAIAGSRQQPAPGRCRRSGRTAAAPAHVDAEHDAAPAGAATRRAVTHVLAWPWRRAAPYSVE